MFTIFSLNFLAESQYIKGRRYSRMYLEMRQSRLVLAPLDYVGLYCYNSFILQIYKSELKENQFTLQRYSFLFFIDI